MIAAYGIASGRGPVDHIRFCECTNRTFEEKVWKSYEAWIYYWEEHPDSANSRRYFAIQQCMSQTGVREDVNTRGKLRNC